MTTPQLASFKVPATDNEPMVNPLPATHASRSNHSTEELLPGFPGAERLGSRLEADGTGPTL
jgi:hypothetical protein